MSRKKAKAKRVSKRKNATYYARRVKANAKQMEIAMSWYETGKTDRRGAAGV